MAALTVRGPFLIQNVMPPAERRSSSEPPMERIRERGGALQQYVQQLEVQRERASGVGWEGCNCVMFSLCFSGSLGFCVIFEGDFWGFGLSTAFGLGL